MGKPFDAAGIIHVWRADADSSHWERVAAVHLRVSLIVNTHLAPS
jgi:hypothetical protein